MVDDVFQRRIFVIDFPPHGRGSGDLPHGVLPSGFERLTRLLESGAAHLARAHEAATELTRAAAEHARALAAFAGCRAKRRVHQRRRHP